MTKDEVIALVREIGGPDRADPVCAQGDMITLDVDEVVRLVNIAAAQQAEQATQLNQSLGLYEQALLDERDALARDAARYRWLRQPNPLHREAHIAVLTHNGGWVASEEKADAAIDAAMKGASDES